MKKVLSFLRSMKLGMILLVLILLLCLAGSMIVQGREASEYTARYGEAGASVIRALSFDRVFTSPLFLVIAAALGINLVDCSVTRFRTTLKTSRSFEEKAAKAAAAYPLSADGGEKLKAFLKAGHFRSISAGNGDELFVKGEIGFWGSFLTHISILLILAVGTFVITSADVRDVTVMPGESAFLDDGTEISVESFQLEDGEGKVDYMSAVRVTLPDGSSSGIHETRVNEPLHFGRYKVYQQSYKTIGSATVLNEESGGAEEMALDDACFLTLDGVSGIYYQGLYPGYKYDENGEILIQTSSSGDYSNPVYIVSAVNADGVSTGPLFPGDELSSGGLKITLGEAVTAPGLRVKQLSGIWLVLLYIVFAMMIAGLWLCFFCVPSAVRVTPSGYSVYGTKPQTGLLLSLEAEGLLPASST